MAITTDDQEISRAESLLAEAQRLKESLQDERLSRRARTLRENKVGRLLAEANRILATVQMVYAAYDAQQKALKTGRVN